MLVLAWSQNIIRIKKLSKTQTSLLAFHCNNSMHSFISTDSETIHARKDPMKQKCLLVERLGVGGGGGDVSVTGSLVRAGGLLQGLGVSKVGGAGSVVGRGIAADEVERGARRGVRGTGKKREHLKFACELTISALRNVLIISARQG